MNIKNRFLAFRKISIKNSAVFKISKLKKRNLFYIFKNYLNSVSDV